MNQLSQLYWVFRRMDMYYVFSYLSYILKTGGEVTLLSLLTDIYS